MKTRIFLLMLMMSTLSIYADIHPTSTHNKDKTDDTVLEAQPGSGIDSEQSRGNMINASGKGKDKNSFGKQKQSASADETYAYYAHLEKRHGWFVGVGKPMSLRDARHLSCYYKLSRKNAAGNWTYIEAFDGYGNPTTNHTLGTYLVNQNDETDSGINKDLRDEILTICKWEFIANSSGKEVIQERALDVDDNIIYIYTPVKVGEREYTGSYTNSWGMPIYLRTDSLGNYAGYANFVHITRDKNGYEVLHAYTDQDGIPQKNKDGAYMTRKEFDRQGRQILEASQNIVGDNMTDDWGNCAWKIIYSENKNIRDFYYLDPNMHHMRMPLTQRHTSGYVYGYRNYFDQYGRDTLIVYIDSLGNPDTDEHGIQKIRTRYNDHGFWTFRGFYDKNGNLSAFDSTGIAQVSYQQNNKGYTLETAFRGADGTFVNSTEGWCLRRNEYADGGTKQIKQIDYRQAEDTIRTFEFTKDTDGNEKRIWYSDNLMRLDSVDQKGRTTSVRYFDLEGHPVNLTNSEETGGDWSAHTYQYDDETNTTMEQWFDKDGNAYSTYDGSNWLTKRIATYDKATHIKTYTEYLYGYIGHSYQQQWDNNDEILLSQWDITPYGEHARVGWYDNLHYTCDVNWTMYGKIRTMVGRNEFGEPSYLTNIGRRGDAEVFHFMDGGKRETRYYDEFGQQIPDTMMETFKDQCPKAFCIEVIDTALAYPLGLKNGDIILSYGDWTISEDLRSNLDYFYLETILKAKENKQLTILRHYPEEKRSEILRLNNLPAGRTSDLGIYPHRIYYTQAEKKRLLTACEAAGVALAKPYIATHENNAILAVQLKGGLLNTRYFYLTQYDIQDPGLVLYGRETWKGRIDTWSALEDTKIWNQIGGLFSIRNSNLWFTQDLSTTRHASRHDNGSYGMRFVEIYVDSIAKNKIESLVIDLSTQIDDDTLRAKVKRFFEPIPTAKEEKTPLIRSKKRKK